MSAIFDKNGARSVCWECRKVHAAKDCPKRERVDWRAVEKRADEVYARITRYWEAQRA